MRLFKKLLIVAVILSIAASYKLGHFDNFINKVIYNKQPAKSKVNKTPANAAIRVQNAAIHTSIDSRIDSSDDNKITALLTFTLKNNSSKTHELVKIESELSSNVSFYEVFFKDNKRSMQQVFGLPIEGFSIVTLKPNNRYAKFDNMETPLKTGKTISIKLIFSDNTEKSLEATVK